MAGNLPVFETNRAAQPPQRAGILQQHFVLFPRLLLMFVRAGRNT